MHPNPGHSPPGRILRGALALASLITLAACTTGGEESGLKSAAVAAGFATRAPQPKDFVVASRPRQELDYVPIFRGGVERPVQPRDVAGVRALESELDSLRDQREAHARRALPRGAYGQPLPSVARPAAAGGSPESYPVSPRRAREMRDNARRVAE